MSCLYVRCGQNENKLCKNIDILKIKYDCEKYYKEEINKKEFELEKDKLKSL